MTKVCGRCTAKKEASEFYRSTTHSSGLQSYCKECHRAYSRDWERNNYRPRVRKECAA